MLKARAWLTDSALLIPIHSDGASQVCVRQFHTQLPLLGQGHKGQTFNYKYLELQDKVLTTKSYDEAREQWKKEKIKTPIRKLKKN